MKKKAIWIGSAALLMITAGVFVARHQQVHSARQQLFDVGRKSEQVFAQYRDADYQTAKMAMLDHRRLLDQMSNASQHSKLTPYAVDAMLYSVRLAKLEEKHSGKDTTKYMQEAAQRCTKVGWENCSEAKLRLVVDQMEAATP